MFKEEPKKVIKKKEPPKPLDLTPITSKLEKSLENLSTIDKGVNNMLIALQEISTATKELKPNNSIVNKLLDINKMLTILVETQKELVIDIKEENQKLVTKLLEKKDNSKEIQQVLNSIQKQIVLTNNLLLTSNGNNSKKVEPSKDWTFTVSRNSEGLIDKVTATSK